MLQLLNCWGCFKCINPVGASLQASFVTTWMEPQAEELISESLNVNYVDTEEVRCVQWGWCVASMSPRQGMLPPRRSVFSVKLCNPPGTTRQGATAPYAWAC